MAKDDLKYSRLKESTCQNIYLKVYINNFVKTFRSYCDLTYSISISGLGNFIPTENNDFSNLLDMLADYGFTIKFIDEAETIESLQIVYTNSNDASLHQLECNIGNLISIIALSSKTGIPTIGIIIMKIVSRLICQSKILFKAIILDLDDTLWSGTLTEEGVVSIAKRMKSAEGLPFVAFMQFVRVMADELGIFVALCSKNDVEDVKKAIAYMDERIFPLKGHLDCVVANNNDKSTNIKHIASKLSILPESIVFIDDNAVVRDEVRRNIPRAFVPEWDSHDKLITLLTISCAFDRYELSLNSRNRKRQFGIIQVERECNALPILYVKVIEDYRHKEASKLYAKSNQFKLVSAPICYEDSNSLVFKIYRANGENLGVCSAITFTESKECNILNWAISCRYFDIGLEEFIALYMMERMQGKSVCFVHQFRKESKKIDDFMHKYYGECITDSCDSIPTDSDLFINYFKGNIKKLLNELKNKNEDFNVYWLENEETLRENTKLKLYE
jgi:FkbH-like protein